MSYSEGGEALERHPCVLSTPTLDSNGRWSADFRASGSVNTVRLGFDFSGFPYKLPTVFVCDKMGEARQHVSWEGVVCISDNEGLYIDVDQPEKVLHKAIDIALAILSEPLDRDALLDEFEGYWASVDQKHGKALSFVELDDTARFTYAYISGVGLTANKRVIAFSDHGIDENYAIHERLQKAQLLKTLYIPLVDSVSIPAPGEKLVLEDIKGFLNNISKRNRTVLEKWLNKTKPFSINPVLFSQPRPRGGVSAFGVVLKNRGSTYHPLHPLRPH